MRPLRYAFAPMEGITGKIFREIHAAHFPGIDRYCLPFFSPTEVHVLTPRQRRELEPGPLSCARLLPQLLTRSAGVLFGAHPRSPISASERST
jgi:tRNA-dihydrouridine synthase